jgi:hypothetical protein
MRIRLLCGLTVVALSAGIPRLHADDAATVQKRLLTEFPLTKITADRSDVVTAGSVLVLHKDGVVMYSTTTAAPPLNTYKEGHFQHNEFRDKLKVFGNRFHVGNSDTGDLNSVPHRTFVTGEKFWVTAITMQPDGAVFDVFSDPFNDVRYYGQVKFPYPKNSPPAADDLLKTVEEVITVQSDDNQKDDSGGKQGGGPAHAPAQNAPAPAALAPIAPPPPPPDQPAASPKTIKVGQTKDEVIATWGQPTKTVKLGSKEICYYPDMKVTFVAGKVSDVQ